MQSDLVPSDSVPGDMIPGDRVLSDTVPGDREGRPYISPTGVKLMCVTRPAPRPRAAARAHKDGVSPTAIIYECAFQGIQMDIQ